jgi:hypothetical protein
MKFDRRRLLRLSGATAGLGVAGLAGCTGGNDGDDSDDGDDETAADGADTETETAASEMTASGTMDDEMTTSDDGPDPSDVEFEDDADLSAVGEVPEYTEWLAAGDDGVFYAYATLRQAGESSIVTAEEEMGEGQGRDPMYGLPASGGLAAGFSLLALSGYGLDGLAADAQGGEETDSNPTDVIVTEEAFVIAGNMNTDEIEAVLTSADQGTEYEAYDSISVFTLFRPVDGTEDVIAVSFEGVVFPNDDAEDPVAAVRPPIEAYRGDRERATDADEQFAWLVSQAADGDIAIGVSGAVMDNGGSGGDEYPALQEADGVVASLSSEFGTKPTTGEFAAVIEDVSPAIVASALGASADERSVRFDGDRVAASGTWNES